MAKQAIATSGMDGGGIAVELHYGDLDGCMCRDRGAFGNDGGLG